MKKFLIAEQGNFYKANLHCHSTVSDGILTPQQLKTEYQKRGYSIIAYTDHDIMLPHFELQDESFLPLTGYEMEVNGNNGATAHICFIAIDPKNTVQGCYHRTEYIWGNALQYRDQINYDHSLPDFVREYTPECINAMMAEMRSKGFFVTYNHPAWSLERYPQYSNYHGMHAMEICNYGCLCDGFEEYNPQIYDDMLVGGERIYCIGTDDNHNVHPVDSRHTDSFGAFTMIKAEKLDYSTITQALLDGQFYASQGPSIYALWLEGNKICVQCSDADRIVLNTGRRRADIAYAEEEPLHYAEFAISENDVYVRLTVIDERGWKANTNAYFIDELFK